MDRADLQVLGDGSSRLAVGLPGAGDGQHALIDSKTATAAPTLGLGDAQSVLLRLTRGVYRVGLDYWILAWTDFPAEILAE